MDAPQRETRGDWHCHCLLIYDARNDRAYCNLPTAGPDEPFCHQCDERHPDAAHLDVTITTYNSRAEAEAWHARKYGTSTTGPSTTVRSPSTSTPPTIPTPGT